MGQRYHCGMATSSLTWCPVFLLEVGFISLLSLLLGTASKVPPFGSWESLTSQISGAFWRGPTTSYLPVSILSAGPQKAITIGNEGTWEEKLMEEGSEGQRGTWSGIGWGKIRCLSSIEGKFSLSTYGFEHCDFCLPLSAVSNKYLNPHH